MCSINSSRCLCIRIKKTEFTYYLSYKNPNQIDWDDLVTIVSNAFDCCLRLIVVRLVGGGVCEATIVWRLWINW